VSIVCGRDSQKNQKVIRSIKFILWESIKSLGVKFG
jgi:hypothetical protein